MRCRCGSDHKVRQHFKDKQWYCLECYNEIMEATREVEDWNGEFIEALGDTSDLPKVRTS